MYDRQGKAAKKRDELQAAYDILSSASRPVNIWGISSESRMDHRIVKRYLERLISKDFIVEFGGYYKASEKGSQFIKAYGYMMRKSEELARNRMELEHALNGGDSPKI